MNDTIVAISTAYGDGAISIVRLTGDNAVDIVNSCFKGANLNKVNTHTIHYGHIIDQKEVVDEVMVSVFKAPKTYTKEDVVEINCHGGMFVTQKILELMIEKGARLAEAGEFTKRAFLNGRIDLTQAEAVMDMIDAKTKESLKMANVCLRGDVKKLMDDLRQKLLTCIAKIEVNIDYPEYEDEEQITQTSLKPILYEVREELENIIKKSEMSLIIKNGIKTAIVGKPNVGKSSLLNGLLREEKAIVTNIAGTTRDIVEGRINIGGVILDLIDTAGIRETEDIVEKIGVNKSLNEIEKADLVILVFDNSQEISSEDLQLLKQTEDKKRIIIINKKDLPNKFELKNDNDYLLVSALCEEDVCKLEEKIKELYEFGDYNKIDATYIGNARQVGKLKEALQYINSAISGIMMNQVVDIVNIDITLAWKALGDIIGANASESLINELFSKFCLGK